MGMKSIYSRGFVFKIVVIVLCLIITTVLFTACDKKASPKEAFEEYKGKWEKMDYKGMYELLSEDIKSRLTEDKFIERHKKIYDGIEAANLTVIPQYTDGLEKSKEERLKVPFTVKMDTLAGNIEISSYEVELVKEKIDKREQWTIAWSDKMIFPDLGPDDKVRANGIEPKRGDILDRNGKSLAANGILKSVQIEPKRFEPDRVASIEAMSKILDIPKEKIEKKLKDNPNPDWAVPIVNLLPEDRKKIDELMPLKGVVFRDTKGRVYPGKEALGALIGYIAPVTAEELGKPEMKGYTAQSLIGKAGLEQVYEKRLRGESGGEIYISKIKDDKEIEKKTIAKKEPKDGENIKVAIDMELQKRIYTEMKGEAGSSAAVNPKTGEILALVSSPSYDANVYSTYIPESKRDALESATGLRVNRFKRASAPGSTFKLVTAAIGLKLGAVKPEEQYKIDGKQWQPDTSWGNYKVTRVKSTSEPINLLKAFMYSDNIYFAQAALRITKENFLKESKNFGIGEPLPIDYPFEKSQLASGDNIKNDIFLADTGYGQGEVLLSPLHIGMIYSSLTNNGDILKPILELKADTKSEVWHEKAISTEHVKLLTDDLVQVVENPGGTGNEAKIKGVRLAGKTGTAEVNSYNQNSEKGENGWFVAFNPDDPKLLVTMMVENVKERGGSHYVIPIVKRIIEAEIRK